MLGILQGKQDQKERKNGILTHRCFFSLPFKHSMLFRLAWLLSLSLYTDGKSWPSVAPGSCPLISMTPKSTQLMTNPRGSGTYQGDRRDTLHAGEDAAVSNCHRNQRRMDCQGEGHGQNHQVPVWHQAGCDGTV